MKKIKMSIYLDPTQVRMLEEIANVTKQSLAPIFREAVNCYLSLSRTPKKEKPNEMV